MTEIEQKALALMNAVRVEYGEEPNRIMPKDTYTWDALCLSIEQHEAFKREVSDAVEAVFAGYHDAPIPWVVMRSKLEPFIIAKPDPLVAVMDDFMSMEGGSLKVCVEQFRVALARQGLEVREIEG